MVSLLPRQIRPRLSSERGWVPRVCEMSLVGAGSAAGSRLVGGEIVFPIDLDLAGDPPAVLDLDLAVGDLAGNMTAGADQQPLAHDEIAFEAAPHLGIIDRCDAFEETGFGDINVVAI